jgi:phage gpG-like protein
MSDELTVDAGRLEDVQMGLQDLGDGARMRLLAAVTEEAWEFERVVKEEKLSGQVLNQVTGTLIHRMFSDVTDDAAGIIGTVGTDTPYAHIHEYGGVIEPVNAVALRFQINGQWVYAKRVVMPERSYLRSTLAERADLIRAAMLGAVVGHA